MQHLAVRGALCRPVRPPEGVTWLRARPSLVRQSAVPGGTQARFAAKASMIEIGGDTDESLAAQRSARIDWLIDLRARAEAILKAAEAGSPTSAVRHHRAWVRAERAFEGAFFAAFRNPYFPRDDDHAAA
jgi:hypothetical protein